jgi:hypothetical protein
VAEFLQIPSADLLAATTADSGGVPSQREDPPSAAPKTKRKTTVEAVRLLEVAFRLFRWKSATEAAAALNVRPDQVRRWRRETEPMTLVDYVSLTAIVNLGIADAMRSPDASTLDLRGATESLGLRIAEG